MTHSFAPVFEQLAEAGYDAHDSGLSGLEIWREGQHLGKARLATISGNRNYWVFELKPAGKRIFRPVAFLQQFRVRLTRHAIVSWDNLTAAEERDFVWAAKQLEALAQGGHR